MYCLFGEVYEVANGCSRMRRLSGYWLSNGRLGNGFGGRYLLWRVRSDLIVWWFLVCIVSLEGMVGLLLVGGGRGD